MNLRAASRDDVPAITAIYNEAVVKTTASYDLEPVTVESRLAWFDDHLTKGHAVLVAERDGAVVGWGSLSTFRERAAYRFTVENSVYVTEACRGRDDQGVQLLDALIVAAQEGGFHTVIAGMDGDNAASLSLHASRGFVEIGRMREVGHKFGRWLDVVFMQRALP